MDTPTHTLPPGWRHLRQEWDMTLKANGMNNGYGWFADYLPAGNYGSRMYLGATCDLALTAMRTYHRSGQAEQV